MPGTAPHGPKGKGSLSGASVGGWRQSASSSSTLSLDQCDSQSVSKAK